MKDNYFSRSILEEVATIRTWYFMWKFPFIKIVNFTGDIKAMQDYVNQKENERIDNLRNKLNN